MDWHWLLLAAIVLGLVAAIAIGFLAAIGAALDEHERWPR